MGGHVRVGLEDNIYIRYLQLATGNAQLVKQITDIAEIFGREIATPQETRKTLNLKGIDKVAY
jgi:3-keto-5-aminohexanoate cleavage enzyme